MSWNTWTPYKRPPGWQATRLRILARDNTLCCICGQPGADEVHHLTRVEDGGTHNDSNLAAIHRRPCHTRETARARQRTKRPTEQRPPEQHPGLI